jgi:hypothetical protein
VLRAIDRIVDAVASGSFNNDEARARMEPLRLRRSALEAEFAARPPPAKVVALHPATVAEYLDLVNDLAATLARRTVEGHEAVASVSSRAVPISGAVM